MRRDCRDNISQDVPISHNPLGRPREFHGFFNYGFAPCLRSRDDIGKVPLIIMPIDDE